MEKTTAIAITKFAALFALLALALFYGLRIELTLESLALMVQGFPPIASFFVFSGLYAFFSVAPIPGRDVFKFLAAATWGWWLSTLYVLTGEILAALIAFILARALGKDLLDRLFGTKLKPFYEKLNESGFRNIFILRILPVTPYRFFNFAAGVTDIKLTPYLAGSLAGCFVRTLFFQVLFTFFADELKRRQATVGQILIFSAIFSAVMLILWFWYSRRKKIDTERVATTNDPY